MYLDFSLIVYLQISTHAKLCLDAATQNFKWVNITHNCLIFR